MTNFDRVSNWLKSYGKQPATDTFSLQVGVMIEEFYEFLDTVEFKNNSVQQNNLNKAKELLEAVGNSLKKQGALLTVTDPVGCLDALCDIDVTVNGVAYFAGFNKNGADNEVMTSNESKFENGKPVYLPGGKIGKGRDYKPPKLEQFIVQTPTLTV